MVAVCAPAAANWTDLTGDAVVNCLSQAAARHREQTSSPLHGMLCIQFLYLAMRELCRAEQSGASLHILESSTRLQGGGQIQMESLLDKSKRDIQRVFRELSLHAIDVVSTAAVRGIVDRQYALTSMHRLDHPAARHGPATLLSRQPMLTSRAHS